MKKELVEFEQGINNKNVIPVIFSCNNNYALHLCCAITSILENANENDYLLFNIICEKNNLNCFYKNLLRKLARKNCQINFINVNSENFKDLPLTNICQHISIETYYRFMLSELFPFFDKMIYLDCEITVLSSLNDLFKINVEKDYIAGVIDFSSKDCIKRLNLKKYCNAGVLLVNLKKWRNDNITQKLFDYALNNVETIIFQDQDVLNVVLQQGIKYIDNAWNTFVGDYPQFYNIDCNLLEKNANIVHHFGPTKPWMVNSKVPLRHLYYIYLNKMSWEYRFLHFLRFKLFSPVVYFLKNFKEKRKLLLWYDSRNQELVFCKKYRIKISFLH